MCARFRNRLLILFEKDEKLDDICGITLYDTLTKIFDNGSYKEWQEGQAVYSTIVSSSVWNLDCKVLIDFGSEACCG